MPNFDGAYEVTAFFDVTLSSRALSHRLTFDVITDGAFSPGDPATSIDVIAKGGLTSNIVAAVDDMFELVWKLMGTGTSQPRFELWLYDAEPSFNKTFITSWTSTETFALGTSTAVAAHQSTYTFRSSGGGVARIQLMEDIVSLETSIVFPTSGDAGAFRTWAIGDGSIIVARDGGYLISSIRANYGQNEKLKRKRFRSE